MQNERTERASKTGLQTRSLHDRPHMTLLIAHLDTEHETWTADKAKVWTARTTFTVTNCLAIGSLSASHFRLHSLILLCFKILIFCLFVCLSSFSLFTKMPALARHSHSKNHVWKRAQTVTGRKDKGGLLDTVPSPLPPPSAPPKKGGGEKNHLHESITNLRSSCWGKCSVCWHIFLASAIQREGEKNQRWSSEKREAGQWHVVFQKRKNSFWVSVLASLTLAISLSNQTMVEGKNLKEMTLNR